MAENSLPSISYKQKIFSDLVPKREHDVSISYKLQVMSKPISGGQFVPSLAEQELTIQGAWGDWREDTISIPINDAIKKMFDEAPIGGDFDIRIVVKYDYPGLPSYEKSYPPTPIVFVPKLYWIPPAP